jgi:hypothetical protein
MRQRSTVLLAIGALIAACSLSASASAQASSYCPVYADNNWRLSWVEEALHAWTKDNRGSTSFDDHLRFCKDVVRADPDHALQRLRDEWETRHSRIVDRLSTWSAQDMVGYLQAWPNRLAYICGIYAGYNVAMSEMGEYLDSNIGSLDESEHLDYCINTTYQNQDEGLEVQQAWTQRYDSVMQFIWDRAAF